MSHQITIWKITAIYGCLSQAACNFRQNDHRWSRFANQNAKISQMITNYYSKANQKIVQSQTRSRPVKNHEKSNTRSNSDRFQVINKYVSAQSHAQNLEKSMSNQLKSPKFQKFTKWHGTTIVKPIAQIRPLKIRKKTQKIQNFIKNSCQNHKKSQNLKKHDY